MSKRRLFLFSFLIALVGVMAFCYFNRQRLEAPAPKLVHIADRVYFASQLKPENMGSLRRGSFDTIVDLRPDGETSDQPASTQIGQAAKAQGMSFFYIPVPHENIPGTAVDALEKVMSDEAGRTVLYCRTGRRAVRTFALAEASRADGPTSKAILEMVDTAGFSADDLKDQIAQRISHRHSPLPPK